MIFIYKGYDKIFKKYSLFLKTKLFFVPIFSIWKKLFVDINAARVCMRYKLGSFIL